MAAPLRVCFAFESMAYTPICNGNFTIPYSNPPVVIESESACPDRDYCGYDPALWDAISKHADLQEGRDWVRVCAGSEAFSYVLEDLAEYENIHVRRNASDMTTEPEDRGAFRAAGACDLFASGLGSTEERATLLGLQFTSPIMQAPMSALIHAPVESRGMWEFFKPLTLELWCTMLMTVVVVPIAVVGMELILSDTRYRHERWRWRGRMSMVHAFGQGVWESAGHFIHTHHFPARTLPGRVLVATYAFVTLVFTNTYLANLAAWTTADRIQNSIDSFDDLLGQPVATITAFQTSVEDVLGLEAVPLSVPRGMTWDVAVEQWLKADAFPAVVFYQHSLQFVLARDTTRSLRMLDDRARVLDTVFAFRRTYNNETVKRAVRESFLYMLESGRLSDLQDEFVPDVPEALALETAPLVPVPLFPLMGVWVIDGAALAVAAILVCIRARRVRTRPFDKSSRNVIMRAKTCRQELLDPLSRACHGPSMKRRRILQSLNTGERQTVRSLLSDCTLMLHDVRKCLEDTRDHITGDVHET